MSRAASPDRVSLLRTAFVEACALELRALKPGNVHVHAAGHGMTVADFTASAEAASGPLCRPGATVGERIRDAVAATRAAVGCNTNLGIVLLAAPILYAAARAPTDGLREALTATLAGLTIADAVAAYAAIRLADPGGLGRSNDQDVAAEPSVTLLAAMLLAAERDRIARQYVTGYSDVFALGLPAMERAEQRGLSPEWAASRAHMVFLSAFPDSHIARKHGPAVAEDVRGMAATFLRQLDGRDDPALLAPPLRDLDAELKRRGINPGTTADLTVATLLVRAVAPIVSS
jgi:triphosphoribosyl-dephospho-CoA synthase